MSAEAQAGASVGRGGFGGLARLRADFEGIMHGAGSDARAYAERICAWLEEISERLDRLDTSDERRNLSANKQAVGAADVLEIDPPRPGYAWLIKNWLVQIPNAQAVSLFVGTQQRAGLRDQMVTSATGFGVNTQREIWVPSGSKVFVSVPAGLAINDLITANLEVIQFKDAGGDLEPARA